jgi:xylan 1,4-beta-xylosidase
MSRIIFLFLVLSIFLPALAAEEYVQKESIDIDYRSPAKPFPHIWENMFGSGRSVLSLQENYREDLRKLKTVADVKYIRFHDIFHDDVAVYDEDKNGIPVYNFTRVDQIYDGLLKEGVRPFVELSFMPVKLSVSPPAIHSFWYHPIVSPPKDWQKWAGLIRAFTTHLIDRYGIEEVSKWYFEVWNEPDIEFWAAQPRLESYYKLYDVTARQIKAVSPRLRVGGPATAMKDWIPSFINYCASNKVPIDFVSTHTYANEGDQAAKGNPQARNHVVSDNVKTVNKMVKSSAVPNLPIIWSEYNASWKNEVDVTDSDLMGPWLANNISLCDGYADEMSFWTFSDVFDEDGINSTPFYGGFGLIATGGIPKASFNAFKLMHMLGNMRLPVNSTSALVTKNADGKLVFAVWNYFSEEVNGNPKDVLIQLNNLPSSFKNARVYVLDKDHGSVLAAWRKMGSPQFPTREQQASLRKSAELPPPQTMPLHQGNTKELNLHLLPRALALVELTP